MYLNDKVRRLRKERNITLRELAKETGIAYGAIGSIERGLTKDPGIKTVIKLANAFNISIDELVGNRTKS